MNISQGKVFEKPVGGSYVGTIIDVVDMPQQTSTFNGKTELVDKVRILWVLALINGTPYLDKEGNSFTVAAFPNAKQAPKAKLTKLLTQILNAAPPLISNSEDLSRLLLGRSNQLFLVQEPDLRNPGQFFTNIAGIAPLPAGVVPPQAPAGFVRFKDKTKTQAGPQGQPVQTYAQPPTNNVSLATPGAPVTVESF
jgi:hypothetical protein